MPYREVDLNLSGQFCNELLQELGNCKAALSSEITRQCKRPEHAKLDPLQRKLIKLRILAERDRAFFYSLLSGLNRTECKGERRPGNFIDLAECISPEFSFRGGMTGGNYKSL